MEPDYTRMLNGSGASEDGDVFSGLYAELKKIAAGRMAMERSDHTLNATALVHEAWLRLQKSSPEKWRDRKQFYAAAAEAGDLDATIPPEAAAVLEALRSEEEGEMIGPYKLLQEIGQGGFGSVWMPERRTGDAPTS